MWFQSRQRNILPKKADFLVYVTYLRGQLKQHLRTREKKTKKDNKERSSPPEGMSMEIGISYRVIWYMSRWSCFQQLYANPPVVTGMKGTLMQI